MTAPNGSEGSSGPSNTMRIAGIGLLAVAVIAFGIGITGLGSESEDTAAPASSTPATTAESAAPTSQQPPAPQSPETPQPETPQPETQPPETSGPAGTPPASPENSAPASSAAPDPKSVPVSVFNNSTVKKLAARSAGQLREQGWSIDAVGNYSQDELPEATVFYGPGPEQQAAGEALAGDLGVTAQPRTPGIPGSGVALIVVEGFSVG